VREEKRRVDQQQQARQRLTRRQLLWAGATVGLLTIAILIGYRYGITLWDWIKLLVVPAVIAAGGLWFNAQQREREQRTANERAQDEALQAYLDQMSDMLISNKDQPSLYDEDPPNSLRTVARARTLTVLPRLDGARKARVVQFLYEARLINVNCRILDLSKTDLRGVCIPEFDLRKANLSGADLRGADLSRANLLNASLSNADLSSAFLTRARLVGTNLTEATLIGADLRALRGGNLKLRGADLSRADLREAILRGSLLSQTKLIDADLSSADLRDADLSGADLRDANLSRAALTGARGATPERLAQANSLEGATMPDGQRLKSADNPDGPTFEEWLKSRGKEDNATPEQRGPWWGGPYHRPWWRRMFGA
jgi:uncharacterized protein YjbI with pentapeptide repeats